MAQKKAFITGITGQDGSYLAEFLLKKGYEVHGLVRRTSTYNIWRLEGLGAEPERHTGRLYLHYGDLSDTGSLARLLEKIEPDEVYNLASQSHVAVSFEIPEYTADVTAIGCLRVLEAIRLTGLRPRFYQASSSEMFGKVDHAPQNEKTPFRPRSPYAIAKLYAHWTAVTYREAYGMFICCGILFNHESPRRGENFVTRKITRAVARIAAGLQNKLYLGNLDAKRDWGYAREYVEAMWLMLQQDEPDDYVIATGELHSVREFVQLAFEYVGLDWREHVEVDPALYRPVDIDNLVGDATKAKQKLGWEPRTRFPELVKLMVDADIAILKAQREGKRPPLF